MNQNTLDTKISKPPYLMGLLGFIPLVGFFIGIVLLLYGIFKYKDKKLILIGISGMIFTILVYTSLFYVGFKSDFGKNAWAKHSQMQLNSLIKNIEFYKLENGHYPDSLQELLTKDSFTFIVDPLQVATGKEPMNFNYKNLGDTYLLLSSGKHGLPNTKDDIFPELTANKNIGWRQSQ